VCRTALVADWQSLEGKGPLNVYIILGDHSITKFGNTCLIEFGDIHPTVATPLENTYTQLLGTSDVFPTGSLESPQS
jgi:hypothetical protein